MSRYQAKLAEISAARNSSNTSLKTRGIKWTKNQHVKMKLIAAEPDVPTKQKIKNLFPTMSDTKANAMLSKIKSIRKRLTENVELVDKINGIRNSKGEGYVYLIENELFDGWIKCGMTTNLTSRLNSYNTNDPLKRFKVIAQKHVVNRRKSETQLLNDMKLQSTLCNGEWFRIDKEQALEIFKCIH